MNTKEAIERVRSRFDKWALDNEDLTALQALGLVDAESEDEKIRKELIGHLKECRNNTRSEVMLGAYAEWIAYLERQKDASKAIEAVERIDKYIKYVRAHTSNAHDMDDSNPDKKYYRGWDDAFDKIAGILQDVYSNEKQKEQKPKPYFYCKYGGTIPLCSDCKRNHYNSSFKTEEITTWYTPSNGTKHCIDYIQKKQKHKFKVGDRVTNGECVYTIDKIGKDCYWVKEHDCVTIPFEYEDTWSIEQKPTNTVKSKFKSGDSIRFNGFGSNEYTIQLVGNGYYVNSEGGRMDMSYTDANFVLVENAQKDQKPIFRVGDTIIAKDGTDIPQEAFHIERIEDGYYWDKEGGSILITNQDEFELVEQEPTERLSREEYVKRFKALCDAYEIKLPNREYDIYHLCDDLSKLSMDSGEQKSVEWNEEDEKMLDKVCCLISPGTILNTGDADYCLELKQWIVSLQERILKLSRTQPKQEWSEEDEKMIDKICHAILVSTYHEKGLTLSEMNQCQSWMHNLSQKAVPSNKRDRWLISRALEYVSMSNENDELKKEIKVCLERRQPQYHWKPSEKQIKAFKNSVEHIPNAYYDDMWELYEQLKKFT